MEQPSETRYAVSIILRSGHKPEQFLIVRRPMSDKELPGHWGLPATSMREDESPEDAARRVCLEKLGCTGEPIRFVGAMHQVRDGYNLLLMDIEVILTGSSQPDIAEATTTSTRYTNQKWTTDLEELRPAAAAGSCCSSIFLTDQKKLARKNWQLKLTSAAG